MTSQEPTASPATPGTGPVQRRSLLTGALVGLATLGMTYLGLQRWNRRRAAGRAGLMGPKRDAESRRVDFADGRAELLKADFPRLAETDHPYTLSIQGGPTKQVLVWRSHEGKVVALDQKCTHQGCLVNLHQGGVFCRCHDSVFSRAGEPVEGPATEPLRNYAVETLEDRYILKLA